MRVRAAASDLCVIRGRGRSQWGRRWTRAAQAHGSGHRVQLAARVIRQAQGMHAGAACPPAGGEASGRRLQSVAVGGRRRSGRRSAARRPRRPPARAAPAPPSTGPVRVRPGTAGAARAGRIGCHALAHQAASSARRAGGRRRRAHRSAQVRAIRRRAARPSGMRGAPRECGKGDGDGAAGKVIIAWHGFGRISTARCQGLRVYAIGDVHGCAGALAALHARVQADCSVAAERRCSSTRRLRDAGRQRGGGGPALGGLPSRVSRW
jgi:hypothetical protein